MSTTARRGACAAGRPRFAAALLALASSAAAAADDEAPSAPPLAVLFIGNSYTYYHRMPAMVSAMARATPGAREVHTQLVVAPGATLQRHWESGEAQRALRERPWDVVILQEQSLRPLNDPVAMIEYARRLDHEARLHGAKTLLFLTWARRERPEAQAALNDAHRSLAHELGATVVPVGPAWQHALAQEAPPLLHDTDGSHPTAAGSYLAACVIHRVLHASAASCPDHPAVPPQVSEPLKRAADAALKGSAP